MGILNLTPDSFSDGGLHNTLQNALKRIEQMEADGADIIDIGAESSGPNSSAISEKEELARLIPILKAARKITKLPISIDTYKAEVARQALEEGANMINDITALRGDAKMAAVIAKHNCPVILMYSKDPTARTTIAEKEYDDVMKTISDFFTERIKYAEENGIKQIILDPGMGHFISALPKYSFEIIERLEELKKFNKEILIGISRKSLLGGMLEERDKKGPIAESIANLNGASIIRTHNIKATKESICQTCN
ncbi:dihydropteroate synthase [Candidatus Gracilibacteria bacterium]|nr:dihydropteroate synthase [Candidatus Gracilibacteria bacterium]